MPKRGNISEIDSPAGMRTEVESGSDLKNLKVAFEQGTTTSNTSDLKIRKILKKTREVLQLRRPRIRKLWRKAYRRKEIRNQYSTRFWS